MTPPPEAAHRHRPVVPLVACDDVDVRSGDGRWQVRTRTRIHGDGPYLSGHFPRLRIFPGVFVLEAVLQGVGQAVEFPVRLRRVGSLRFLSPLRPGDELCCRVEVAPAGAGRFAVAGDCLRGDRVRVATVAVESGTVNPLPDSTAGRDAPEGADHPADGDPASGLDLGQLRCLLPHGPEMMLLDRVEWLRPGAALRATRAVSGAEPCYRFPGLDLPRPPGGYAYPRSLVLESFGQAAAVLWLRSTPPSPDQVLMFVAARDCTFSGQAYPGDVLSHLVRLDHRSQGAAFASGRTTVGSRTIATYRCVTAVVRPHAAVEASPRPYPIPTPKEQSHG